MMPPQDLTYFRKGFGLKSEVQDELASDYDGRLVDFLRAKVYTLTCGVVTVRRAKEFGVCTGGVRKHPGDCRRRHNGAVVTCGACCCDEATTPIVPLIQVRADSASLRFR